MSKESEAMRALREDRRRAGLCIRCGEKARPLRTECQKCADVQQRRNESYRNQRRLRQAGMTPRPAAKPGRKPDAGDKPDAEAGGQDETAVVSPASSPEPASAGAL